MALLQPAAARPVVRSVSILRGKIGEKSIVLSEDLPFGFTTYKKGSIFFASFYQSGTQTTTDYEGLSLADATALATAQSTGETYAVATAQAAVFVFEFPYLSHSKKAEISQMGGDMYRVSVTEETRTVTGRAGL